MRGDKMSNNDSYIRDTKATRLLVDEFVRLGLPAAIKGRYPTHRFAVHIVEMKLTTEQAEALCRWLATLSGPDALVESTE